MYLNFVLFCLGMKHFIMSRAIYLTSCLIIRNVLWSLALAPWNIYGISIRQVSSDKMMYFGGV